MVWASCCRLKQWFLTTIWTSDELRYNTGATNRISDLILLHAKSWTSSQSKTQENFFFFYMCFTCCHKMWTLSLWQKQTTSWNTHTFMLLYEPAVVDWNATFLSYNYHFFSSVTALTVQKVLQCSITKYWTRIYAFSWMFACVDVNGLVIYADVLIHSTSLLALNNFNIGNNHVGIYLGLILCSQVSQVRILTTISCRGQTYAALKVKLELIQLLMKPCGCNISISGQISAIHGLSMLHMLIRPLLSYFSFFPFPHLFKCDVCWVSCTVLLQSLVRMQCSIDTPC